MAATATRQVVAALVAVIEPHLSSNFKADVHRQLAAAQPPPIRTPVVATVDSKKTVGVAKMMGQSFTQGFMAETNNRLNSGGITKTLASPAQAKAAAESGKRTGNAYGDGVTSAIASPAQTKATSDAGAKHGKSFGAGFGSTLKGVIAGIGIAGLLSKATTGASTFFKGVIAEGKEAAVVGRQTEAALKSTGGAAGRTREQIESLSASLSKKIGIDDEEIQKNANMLLSYRRVSGEVFDRAIPAIQDLSAKMGISGTAAAKLLGKALNDPIKGTAGLAKAGIKLTESQKDQILKAMELGDVQKAQGIILGQLEKVTGGQAEASVTAAEKQKVAWANFQEEIGNKLFPAMERFRNFITASVIPALSGLWSGLTGGKEKLSGVAGEFQAFGQKIIGFINEWKPKIASFVEPGVNAIKTFISYLHGNKDARTLIGALVLAGVAFLAFNVIVSANPISLVIIAVAALVVGLSKLYKSSDGFRKFWDSVIYPIFKLWVSYMKNIVIPGIIGLGKTVVGIFKTVSGAVQTAWKLVKPPLASFISVAGDLGKKVQTLWKQDLQPAFRAIGSVVRDAWTKSIQPTLKAFTGGVSDVGKKVNVFWKGTVQPAFKGVGDVVREAWTKFIQPALKLFTGGISDAGKKVNVFWKGTVQPAFKGIGSVIHDAWTKFIQPALKLFTGGISDSGKKVNTFWKGTVQPAFKGIGSVIHDAWTKFIQPALKLFTGGISDAGKKVNTFWKGTVQPAFKGIGSVIHDAWTKFIQPALKLFTTGISDSGKKVNVFWKGTVQPAFKGIGSVIHDAWTKLISPALKLFTGGVGDVGKKVNTVWKNVLSPAFKAIGALVRDAWTKLIQPSLKAFITVSGDVGKKVSTLWKSVLLPAFKGMGTAAQDMWTKIIQPTMKAFISVAGVLGTKVRALWQTFIAPAFKGVSGAVTAAWAIINVALKAFISTATNVGRNVNGMYVNYIKPAFTSMWQHIGAAWVFIRDKVFNPMKAFVTESMPAAFKSGVEAIRGIWNTLKSAAAKPVLFVLETVYQNGIRKGWQAIVAKIPGVPDLPDLSANVAGLKLAGLRTGGPVSGQLHGPGTPTSDSFTIMASDQEYMLRAKSANRIKQKYGPGTLDHLNTYGEFPRNQFPGYAGGGSIGSGGQSVIQILQYANQSGIPYSVSSTYRDTNDYHGQGKAVDMVSSNMAGLANWWMARGGGLLELIHQEGGKRWAVKNGMAGYQGYNSLFSSGDPSVSHRNHVHVAMNRDAKLGPPGVMQGGGGLGDVIAMVLKKVVFGPLYDKLTSPLKGKPGGEGLFNKTATGITGFAIDGIKKGVETVLGKQTMPDPNGGGGPVPPGYIPTYFTYFGGADDASTAGMMMANGEPPSRPAFASSYWPLGTVATIDIGGHKERLIQKDLGPNKFVYDRHPGINVIDLTYNAMKKFRNPPNNTSGGIKVESWGGGRTLYGFRAKGYDQGGILEHGDLGLNMSGKPEAILTHDESKGLKSMASDLTSPYSGAKTGGGNSTLVLKVMLDGTEITDKVEYILEEHDAEIIRHLAKN